MTAENTGGTPATSPTAGPMLGICGWSGSGKTTLIETVIPHLRSRGLRVAVIKHTSHGFQIDRKGKDSDRIFQAGADILLEADDESVLRYRDGPLRPRWSALHAPYDLILVEGHKDTPVPKVWLRSATEDSPPAGLSELLGVLDGGSERSRAFLSLLEPWLSGKWLETPVRGCVLIGGRSRRMGFPKHLLEIDGKTWLQRTCEMLAQVTSGVAVAGAGRLPEGLEDTRRMADVDDARGPMAGILSVMRWAPGASWLVTACDLPLLSAGALEWVLSTRGPGVWATLPRLDPAKPDVQPLLAHYDPRCLPLLEGLAADGEYSLSRLAGHPQVRTPSPSASLALAWQDVDTPSDLQRVG